MCVYVNPTFTDRKKYQLYERKVVSGLLIKKGAGNLLHSDQLNHLETTRISFVLILRHCRNTNNSSAYLLLNKVDVGADS
jgi:hypothetical protein